ncbi:winged helix-turn-helix domain-containing protein [Saccharothrix sp. ALI-22-I]|uniref:winged helix-turn-helix domain-containing protein n=1 Tax=Saccharothrix sp. ALI-22-I TaxID=1933778 RepID=UPI000A06EDDD|nr:winged helix-turn-helix domain-containing protein [Saccharothrix sp. ALI-22-I]
MPARAHRLPRRTWEAPSRTLDTHIAALRRELGDALRIETIRGVGHRVAAHT